MHAHAEYFNSPSGLMPIRQSIQDSFEEMTDRDVANKAFGETYADPEYLAELVHRNLSGIGVSRKETMTRIDLKEASEAAPKMKMGF